MTRFSVPGETMGNQVLFTIAKENYFGENANDDFNIGTSSDQQQVMLMRVPNYRNMTLNGTITGEEFHGSRYGLLAFRFSGTLSASESMTFTYDDDGRPVMQVVYDGSMTVTTLYFAGGMYEIQHSGGGGETIVWYFIIGGQPVARYDGTDLEYMLTDAQGSTVVTLNNSGKLLSEQRYLLFGDVRTDIDTAD